MRDKKRWCPLFGKCGGCDYVNETYDYELMMKWLREDKLLGRYGRVEKVLSSPSLTGYRCKVQAVCGRDRDGKFITGQYRKGSHHLFPIRSCSLEDGMATAVLQTVRQMATRFSISPFDEDRGTGDLRHILIRTGWKTRETMVVLVTAKKDFPHKDDFVSAIHQKNPNVVTVVQVINNEKTSMVIPKDSEEIILWGKGYIVDNLCGLDFRISAKSFYQVNPEMAERLYEIAMNMARLRPTDTVIDAYCGTGTIGLVAASRGVKEVIGIESNPDAVKDAKLNAEANGISNARFIVDDASKWLKSAQKEGQKCDVLFLDPPRAGSSEEFLAAAGRMEPEVIVYISCNPETLARDLRYIVRFLPYKVLGIQPVDLFPGSESIETVVLLSKIIEKPKTFFDISVEAKDYYRIKDRKKN
ncbi:MAG: 23S rRNA (uracil(1939)-C(5))-methyltransferase RlmD [Candidatus Ornithospirochaeta sp.]|nr:23S rRNA (uracil(1939)-C(5))-methyltransferase RlmD [Sphaerochaetaceae bacterium]MDY5523979.1 23S rRNA (uracil(1939)-C(5))-methyltransferase RlmD [Candidatus Ornithospirochaeta sp.]